MTERIFNSAELPELKFELADSQARTAWQLLEERYRGYQNHELPSGDTVTVLSTCVIPLSSLIRENWQRQIPIGIFRGGGIRDVNQLLDGTDPKIVVKEPERIFTKERRFLDKDNPFWGGKRSGEKRTPFISGNPVVEEQAIWEAIILLELHRLGLRAEIPQALIQAADGK